MSLHGTPLDGLEHEIDALRETGLMFYNRGWSLGTSSNYSVVIRRDPLELLVTASGKDKGRLTRHDFVRVDEHARPVVDGQPKSSAETLLHVAAASQPGVNAVLHTHSVWATLLSDYYLADGGVLIEGYEMLKGLSGVVTHEHREWVPVFENTQDIPSLAQDVTMSLGANPPGVHTPGIQHGYLIHQHGLYTWGASLEEARRHIEIYEFLFECVARKLMLQGAVSAAVNV